MTDWKNIRDILPVARRTAAELREVMLANLVLICEIPAPTFAEADRVRLILQRFTELGLENCSSDDFGNGFGLMRGTEGGRTLLLEANADTFVADRKNQAMEIFPDRIVGPFVGDNSLALAAMVTLPTLLERLGLRLRSDVLFMAASRILNRGNIEGLRQFLDATPMVFSAGLCVEGVQIGRLNHRCLGMLRGEILCRLPDDYRWSGLGSGGSIVPMSDVIQRLSAIPIPQRPQTTVVLGSIHGGLSYQNIARETLLKFEVRSESRDVLAAIRSQIQDVCDDVAAHKGVEVRLDIFANREPGGLDGSHPMVKAAKAVQSILGIPTVVYSTTSALSALADKGIPAVTVGVTAGERHHELDEIDEFVSIEPMAAGLAQLAGLLMAMDGEGRDGPAAVA